MRHALPASLYAMFLGGSLAFGQNFVVKIGTPKPFVPPTAPVVSAPVDEPDAIRTASYATVPPALPAAMPTSAPAAAPSNSVFPVGALTADPEAASAPAPAVAAYADAGCDTWTGFYVGLNTGGAIGAGSTQLSAAFRSDLLGNNGLVSGSGHDSPTAWIVGGQIGYDRQVSQFVVGVEADWEWTNQKDSNTAFTPAATGLGFFGAGANGFGYLVSDEHKITDIGTIRARSGIVVGNSLLYATGGLAWGTVKETLSFRGSAQPIVFPVALQPGPFLPVDAISSQTRFGYALGGGIETKLSTHWSVKAEYVFVGLGKISHSAGIGINPVFGPAFTTGGVALATSNWLANDNIVRLGLNYRF